jgi:membrane protease YdiL (CAAX protease family)
VNPLALLSNVVNTACLAKCVIDRGRAGRPPLPALLRDRWPAPRATDLMAGAALGTAAIVAPVAVSVALGWERVVPAGGVTLTALLLALASVLVKFVWAAMEELMARGGVIPQLTRLTGAPIAVVLGAVLFSLAHLERSGARAPGPISLLTFAIDGMGFGLAYLATRSLWMPTVWHTVRNVWVWALLDEGTLQFTPGFGRATYSGPEAWVGAAHQAGWMDVASASVMLVLVVALYRGRILEGFDWVKTQ